MKVATIIMAVLALLTMTACRDSDAEKQADACTELNDLQASIAALTALGPTSTVEQYKDAAKQVRESAQDAARAVRRVEEDRADDLRDAEENLDDAVDDVDSDQTAVGALAQIQPQVAAVAAARDQMTASLNCR
jgi:ribosome recycling factor